MHGRTNGQKGSRPCQSSGVVASHVVQRGSRASGGQHAAHQSAVEEPGLGVADIAGQPPLGPPEPRLLGEDREVPVTRLHP